MALLLVGHLLLLALLAGSAGLLASSERPRAAGRKRPLAGRPEPPIVDLRAKSIEISRWILSARRRLSRRQHASSDLAALRPAN